MMVPTYRDVRASTFYKIVGPGGRLFLLIERYVPRLFSMKSALRVSPIYNRRNLKRPVLKKTGPRFPGRMQLDMEQMGIQTQYREARWEEGGP